ncbi:MAG TPA: hypothetical protein ENH84_05670 [Phycisphaerae bacterium]|nr:hypothetical protein [Phycisphaerae bacterium]
MLETISLNLSGLIAVTPSGMFGSPVKLLIAMLFAAVWLFFAPMISEDTIRIHINRQLWTGMYLGTGVVGLLIWFVLPIYIAGLLLFTALVFGGLIVYVAYRNAQLEPIERIGTRAWFAEWRDRRNRKPEQIETRLRMYDSEGRAVILSETEATEQKMVRAYNLTQSLLFDLARIRASEADITLKGEKAQVRCIIDGVITKRPPLSGSDADKVIQFIKGKAGGDVNERRRPQKGKISVDLAGSPIDMEIITAGTSSGQRMQIRITQEIIQSNIDLLGIDEDMAQAVLNTISDRPGLLIVSGAPKSGLTSTLYSLLRKQDAYIKLLVTVESKPAMDLENVTQNPYGKVENLNGILASVTRRDPDVILLDNCPDEKIAQMVCQFAKEKSIIVEWHAKDSFTALAKWVMMVGSASRAIKPLRGVLCQTLIRKICPSCREPYHPDPKLLAKINMPAEQVDVFYRPPTQKPTDSKGNIVPCQTCQDSGYYGRTGVFEFLKITDDLMQLIGKKASLTHIKAAARKNKMLYMQENGLAKVVKGVTSIQEVIRTFQQDPAKKQASSRSR